MSQFKDLPIEIVENIIDYCYFADDKPKDHFKSLALVCKQWLQILEKYHRKYFVIIGDIIESYSIFEKSFRNFYNIRIINKNFFKIQEFVITYFTLPHMKITSLDLIHCGLDIDILLTFIKELKYLKELYLTDNGFGLDVPFKYNKLLLKNEDDKTEDIKNVSDRLSQLTHFKYENNSNFTLHNFLAFIDLTKNLRYFEMEEYGRQTPKFVEEFNNIIYSALTNNMNTLRELRFRSTSIFNENTNKLLESYKSTNIESLQLGNIKMNSLMAFLNIPNINIINLTLHFAIENLNFDLISENLKNIEYLKITYCTLSNLNLYTLSKCKKLREFEIEGSKFDFRTENRIPKIESIKTLKISRNVRTHPDMFLDIADNIPNIEYLSIEDELNFDDIGMKTILEKLTSLKVLSIRNCDLTDYEKGNVYEEYDGKLEIHIQ